MLNLVCENWNASVLIGLLNPLILWIHPIFLLIVYALVYIYFVVVGSRYEVQMVNNFLCFIFILKLINQCIIGDGNNMYDFTYVGNVAHAHICAERALASDETVARRAAGEVLFHVSYFTVSEYDSMTLFWQSLCYNFSLETCLQARQF